MFLSCSTVFLAAAVMASAGNFESLPDYTPDANAERQTIPGDYIWNLSVLFADDEAWSLALEETGAKLETLASNHDTLDRPDGLVAYMAVMTIWGYLV